MSHVLYLLIKSASGADGIWEQHILIRKSRICISERENERGDEGEGGRKNPGSFGTDQLADLLSSLLADRPQYKDGAQEENRQLQSSGSLRLVADG